MNTEQTRKNIFMYAYFILSHKLEKRVTKRNKRLDL